MTISLVRVLMRDALGRAGHLTADELERVEAALDELQRQVDTQEFVPSRE